MVSVTVLGQPSILVLVSLGLGIGLLNQGRRSQATTLVIAALGAVGLNYGLKQVFARDRPALWDRVVDVCYYSFPSGHAMVSMVMYGLIGYLLATRCQR